MKKITLAIMSLAVLALSACNPVGLVSGLAGNAAANAIKNGANPSTPAVAGATTGAKIPKATIIKYMDCIVSKAPEVRPFYTAWVAAVNSVPDADWEKSGMTQAQVEGMTKAYSSLGCGLL